MEEALVSEGRPAPAPALLQGLVDTGASKTCVPLTVLKKLGLFPSGSVPCENFNGGIEMYDQYAVQLLFEDNGPRVWVKCVAIADPQGALECLIGRDVLRQCRLAYDGYDGRYVVEIVGMYGS